MAAHKDAQDSVQHSFIGSNICPVKNFMGSSILSQKIRERRGRFAGSIKPNPLDPKAWKKNLLTCICPKARHWTGDIRGTDSNAGQVALEGHSSSRTPLNK